MLTSVPVEWDGKARAWVAICPTCRTCRIIARRCSQGVLNF